MSAPRTQTFRILVRESLFHEYEVEARSREQAVGKMYRDIDRKGFEALSCVDNDYCVEDVCVLEGGAE